MKTLLLNAWTATKVIARVVVWLVDRVCQAYLRNTDPKHAVTCYALLNVAVTIFAWCKSSDWNAFYTIAGYWATVTGLSVAILELYEHARWPEKCVLRLTAKYAASATPITASAWNLLTHASLNETAAQVQSRMWKVAVARLGDRVNHLSRVNSVSPAADDFWSQSANSLQPWIVRFDTGIDRQRLQYNGLDWQQFVHAIGLRLHGELAVFQPGAEGGHDPE